MSNQDSTVTTSTDGESPPLSTAVIIAVCVVCGVVLFAALAFLVICLSRKKHRKRQLAAQRNLDLADDLSIHNALDSAITPVEHPLEKTSSGNPFRDDGEPHLQEWYSKTNGKVGTKDENGDIIPPAYAFHITGSRDSWPLVSFTTTPKLGVLPDQPGSTLRPIQPSGQLTNVGAARTTDRPITVSKVGVRRDNPTGHGLGAKPSVSIKQPQMFTFGPHPSAQTQQQQQQQQLNTYPYPPPLSIRPSSQTYGPPAAARHARAKSSNSIPRYRTETDTQLITVLKSTSQRLREAQAAAASQAAAPQGQANVLKRSQPSAGFGAVGDGRPSKTRSTILSPLTIEPPKEKAHTPKKTHISALLVESEPAQRETWDGSVCDSTHTSVLDMFYTSEIVKETPKKQTTEEDEEKSLFGTENRIAVDGTATATPVDTPSSTTVRKSAGGTPVTVRKLHHDSITMHQLSSITRGANAATRPKHERNQSSTNDPFVIKGSPAAQHITNMAPAPSNIGAIRPLRLSRGDSLLKDNNPALRPRSGNKQSFRSSSPPKLVSACANAPPPPEPQPPVQLQFEWPVADLPVLPPPSSRQNKGHKRSKTVRLSYNLRRSSIEIVHEEKEDPTPPKDSQMERYNSRASNLSGYAGMSILDMYSSPSTSRSPSRSPTRSPSRLPERYHRGRSASVSSLGSQRSSNAENHSPTPALLPPRSKSTHTRQRQPTTSISNGAFHFPASESMKADERLALSELKSRVLRSESMKHLSASPTRIAAATSVQRIRGPRESVATMPVGRNSVQASIGLLRRMNSVMSTSSLMSQNSVGNGGGEEVDTFNPLSLHPTLGKETSPVRQDTLKRGQNNYLGLGQNRTSPTRAISKRVSELAMQIEARSPSPERRNTLVVHEETMRGGKMAPPQIELTTPTKSSKVLMRKGFETDRFGNPLGCNALGIVPVLSPPTSGMGMRMDGHELKGVKSSPTLGKDGENMHLVGLGISRKLSEKDSGVDMREEGKDNEKEPDNGSRESLYDEHGFLKASPARK